MTKEFVKQIAKIQQQLKAPKNQRNNFGGYNYRSAEDILEAVTPLLGDLILTVNDEMVLIGDRYYVKATAQITDGENSISTTAYARESLDKKGMDDSQITGATSSYARKYALNGLLKIDDQKDADATNTHDKASKAYPQPTVSKQVTQPTGLSTSAQSGRPTEKQVALLDKLYSVKRIPKPSSEYTFDEAKVEIQKYMVSIGKGN